MTSQGKEDLKIFKMASRAQLEFVGEGADVTGEGEDFQNFKMALRAFRIGATYCMFKVLWVRVGIWARLGKFSRFFHTFRIGATCWIFKVLWARVAAAQSPHARGDRCAGPTATDSWKFKIASFDYDF